MKQPSREKKTAIPPVNDQVGSAVDAAATHRTKNMLPLTHSAELAAQKAVCFLHPGHGNGMSHDEYHEAICLILEQACLAIANHRATATLLYEKKKGRKKVAAFHSSIANDCWPPAFDLRSETDDERFARLVLSQV